MKSSAFYVCRLCCAAAICFISLQPFLSLSSEPLEIRSLSFSSFQKSQVPKQQQLEPLRKLRPTNASFPFAYAFVISGCKEENINSGHLGFIYNILVTANILEELGSKADVVAIFQMSATSNSTTLPSRQVQLLIKMGVRVEYLPQAKIDTFYHATLQKFCITELIQYRRVMFLDGDLIPSANLDYLFEASISGLLRPNVVIAGPLEPANGGIFMLQPVPGDYARIQAIILRRQAEDFDTDLGWGHRMEEPDNWRGTRNRGRKWNWQAVHADQGLLYYWVKYACELPGSLIQGSRVEHWKRLPNGTASIEKVEDGNLDKLSHPVHIFIHACRHWGRTRCISPYDSFLHFTGNSKPWLGLPPSDVSSPSRKFHSKKYWWWWQLQQVDKKLGMGLNLSHWKPLGKPTLGFMVLRADAYKQGETMRQAKSTPLFTINENRRGSSTGR